MRIDKNNPLHIIADEGKVLQRIKDGVIVGKEHILKEIYSIGCMILEEPYMETVEDFRDVNPPKHKIIDDEEED